ncbi:hypothetical protein B0J12DRAFT_184428 [Macrophomina phaseolina]|uniref:Acyl-CoA N-acyltransferase n=1 Tax=Macrophomina phaseolina TaxID=35725 RepID=A0ABQ8G7N1_9PEZI|nr:hypothetical protein B0J12DRAFT_184428 [Macrophomina phaseolina]
MAGLEPKPQYIPPHLRPRQLQPQPHREYVPPQPQAPQPQPQDGYVPPHLRQKMARVVSVNDDRREPYRAFHAAQNKWATQHHAGREGGTPLTGDVAFSNIGVSDGGVALNGGVAVAPDNLMQSSAQPTAALTSATTSPLRTSVPHPIAAQTQEDAGVNNLEDQQHNGENCVQDQSPHPPPTMGQRARCQPKSSHGKSKRNDKWVTNKQIRERVQRDSTGPVGAWGSDGSDAGFNSNPGGDPQHDIRKLVDWQGNWLPGPTDWEFRRSYRHHGFNEEMMRFVYDSIDKEAAVDIYNEPTFLQHPNGEVAPRVWASLNVEGMSLQQWWNNHVGTSLADPDSRAWWRAYHSLDSSLLIPHDVPQVALDPQDHEGQILHLYDHGSGKACEKLVEEKNKRRAAREKRRAMEREFAAAMATAPSIKLEPSTSPKIRPTISLYLRPALAADAHQIVGIYNHYIRNSIRSPEVEQMTPAMLSQRIASETMDGMPWLVACQKGKKGGRGYTNGTDALILGFACASDYHGRRSMYGFTAEAEVYVHPNYLRQKVGSCLMDRLLHVLDPSHYALDGYQFIGNGPLSEQGGVRVIGSSVMNVPFNKKDPEDLKGVTKFLNKFGFKKEAELPNLGVKQEKYVSLGIFRYYTGNTIDPRSAIVD